MSTGTAQILDLKNQILHRYTFLDSTWSNWGSWESCELNNHCSSSGTMTRYRTCSVFACSGSSTDTKSCEGGTYGTQHYSLIYFCSQVSELEYKKSCSFFYLYHNSLFITDDIIVESFCLSGTCPFGYCTGSRCIISGRRSISVRLFSYGSKCYRYV